jgi:hypothetical protein
VRIATESKYSPRSVGVFAHAAQYHDGAIDDGTIERPWVPLDQGNDAGTRKDTGYRVEPLSLAPCRGVRWGGA